MLCTTVGHICSEHFHFPDFTQGIFLRPDDFPDFHNSVKTQDYFPLALKRLPKFPRFLSEFPSFVDFISQILLRVNPK